MNPEWALVVDWEFHVSGRWVCAMTPYLVEALIAEFQPRVIQTQEDYEKHKRCIKNIVAFEPGWGAPKLRYDKKVQQKKAVLISDPHNKTSWLEHYVLENDVDHVLSFYFYPFFYHFPRFPGARFIHFPWAVPDQFLLGGKIEIQGTKIGVFGGKSGPAYDIRNQCRNHPGVVDFNNSGVENKKMTNEEYYYWLRNFDALIAAGSSHQEFNLVTPKYFEIPAAGSLLIGQSCRDLALLGFNRENMMVFTEDSFNDVVSRYESDPLQFLGIRRNGLDLIRRRHLVSHRVTQIRELFSH